MTPQGPPQDGHLTVGRPGETAGPDGREGSLLLSTLAAVRTRWRTVLLCSILVPAVAVGVALLQDKQYTASASLLFRDPALDQKLFGSSVVQESNDPTRDAQTNVRLVSLDVINTRTARQLGGNATAKSIEDEIDVALEGESDVVRIDATDPDPIRAAVVANTFAEEYIEFRREADRSKVREAQELVDREIQTLSPDEQGGPARRALRERADQLEILSSLQTGNAELVQRAEPPDSPSSPRPVLNTVLGFFLGLGLGVGAAWLRERLDRRLTDSTEVAEIFGRPVLGEIPETWVLQATNAELAEEEEEEMAALNAGEAFRLLRANLRYFKAGGKLSSILVTSAVQGEGKSTIAWHFSAAAARSGERVLLIEADLRRPTLGPQRSIDEHSGLSSVLSEAHTLSTAIQTVSLAGPVGRSRDPIRHDMDVLAAGPRPPNPAELLESPAMRELLEEAQDLYDLVVIDTPPTSAVADAIPLISNVSGVLVVSRLNWSTRDATQALSNQLDHLGARVFGVVINGVESRRLGSYYSYGYSSRSKTGDEGKQRATAPS